MSDLFFDFQFEPNRFAKIRFQQYGTNVARQTPLLFIHGYGAMIEHWNLNIPVIEQNRFCYAMDLIGFGDSEKPDATYGIELWSSQIKAFLDKQSISKIIIVGHSMGGASSLAFAHRFPQYVSALMMIDSSGFFPDDVSPLEKLLYRAVGSPVIGEAMFGIFANPFMAKQSLVQTYLDPSKVTDELVEQFSKPFNGEGASRAYLAPSRYPERFLLDAFPKPCNYKGLSSLVWGEHDVAFPKEKVLPKFKMILPQASESIIPNTKHCPHHEEPELFNELLLKYLEKHQL